MKKLFLSIVISMTMSSVFAADDKKETDKKSDMMMPNMMQMHENMAKAHQDAANCLKSGKSEDECRMAFQAACKEHGGRGECGMMMKGRADKKKK